MKGRIWGIAAAAALLLTVPSALGIQEALGSHTPPPTGVTIAGSLQSELGCPGDWDPACPAGRLTFDADDQVWQGTFTVPAGSWEYKAALNGGWDENYGANAQRGGSNIGLTLGASSPVKFYYDHKTHWITDNRNALIVTAPGSYQQAIGCANNWDPSCLRSWLEDPDGDGVYTMTLRSIPAHPPSPESKTANVRVGALLGATSMTGRSTSEGGGNGNTVA